MICFSTSLTRINKVLPFPKEDMYELKNYKLLDCIIQHKGGMHFRVIEENNLGDFILFLKSSGIAISIYTEKAKVTKTGKVKGEIEEARESKAYKFGIVKVRSTQMKHKEAMDEYEQESIAKDEENLKAFFESKNTK